MFTRLILNVVTAMCISVFTITVQAEVVIETVTVGNPGNEGELSGAGAGGYGPDRISGAVDYVYNIGRFEVTAGQYTEFLNAVADEDTYELYNTNMWSSDYGCKIRRIGGSGSYEYLVDADGDDVEDPEWVDRPVNFVSWGDAARFCNWLHNGQPTGSQNFNTTEDGSYFLNGATTDAELIAIVRQEDATWVIPSEDEWHKAAYHKNDGVTGNYWDFPTSTDAIPNNGNPEGDTGNSANFDDGDYSIGSPYWRTEVGYFSLSGSPYGTFDQGGNVWEWNEAVIYDSYRGIDAASFLTGGVSLHASFRSFELPTSGFHGFGFRVVEVPEPGPDIPAISEWGVVTMTLLVLTGGSLVLTRRRVARP
jgi:formylglycine-generating enzyme required for sulfatase activity